MARSVDVLNSIISSDFVLAIVVALLIAYNVNRYLKCRAARAFGKLHGCQLTILLRNELPWGLDRVYQIFSADSDQRLMELFLMHFRWWGNTLEQCFLGTRAFGTIDTRNIEAILSTQFEEFGFGPRRAMFSPLLGDGIFTQEGPAWKHSRELLRPQFARNQYKDLNVFKEHMDNLISNIPASRGVVNLQPLFFRFTLDTTTAFLFGESAYSLSQDRSLNETEFADAFNVALDYLAKRFRLFDAYWLINSPKMWRACRVVQDFVDKCIEKGLSKDLKVDEKTSSYNFLRVVAKESRDRIAIRNQLLNILIAGRDTTACLLSWTFRLLVRHPAVLNRLRDEIQSVAGNNSDLTREDLKKMTYLSNVLKETLRLYPPAPMNTRTCLKTTTLPRGGGPYGESPVLIQKGEGIAYSVYALHRRRDLYGDDSEDFRPERWEGDLPLFRNETDKNWGYLPFNGGPRVCLGQDFALIEASYVVVRLLQRFPNIEMPSDEVHEKIGKEKQLTTLVMAIGGTGCQIQFD